MTSKEIFARQFQEARKEMGLSQHEMADRLGVSRTVISSWETGRASPLLERLDDIAQVLDKPIAYFFPAVGSSRQTDIDFSEVAGLMDDTVIGIEALREHVRKVDKALGLMMDAMACLGLFAHPEDQATGLSEEQVLELKRVAGPDAAQGSPVFLFATSIDRFNRFMGGDDGVGTPVVDGVAERSPVKKRKGRKKS